MNNNKEFTELLEKNQLKKTSTRFTVLDILKSRESAISQPDLEGMLGKNVDRVTLYRTLATFEEKGIIHKVLNINGTANYALCSSSCNEHEHHDEHVHFNCTKCLSIFCLDHTIIPSITIPEGYVSKSLNLVVYGLCKNCNQVVDIF